VGLREIGSGHQAQLSWACIGSRSRVPHHVRPISNWVDQR